MQAGRWFLAACFLLGGCASGKDLAHLSCPETGYMRGTEKIMVYGPDPVSAVLDENAASDVIADIDKTTHPLLSIGQIGDFSGGCRFNDNSVEVRVDITFLAAVGPAGKDAGLKAAHLPYFVSVLSPDEKILRRESYALDVELVDGQGGQKKERIQTIIPLTDKKLAGSYKLVFGFQVPEEQWQQKPKQERVVSGVRGFNLESFWDSETREHQETFAKTAETLFGDFEKLVDACELAVRSGGKILFFGNGGSAADAQHLATELAVRYKKDRPAIAAIALTTDTSALTAIGNDFGFDRLFARQIEALGKKGDIAIGISTSGKSENVLNALKSAKEQGLVTAGLTGGTGGKMTDNCDIVLCVPSKTTARIQEMHIMLGQMLCGALELRLGLVEE